VDGNEYIDFVCGLGPISLGYRYPAVDEAVRTQLEKGIIAGLLWPLEVEVARGLVEAIPCAEMVRYLKGGGEATAAAARIARGFTGRHVILNAGYRGWPDTWSAGRDTAVPPEIGKYVLSFGYGDVARLERLLEEHKGQVAAVFTGLPYDGSAGAEYLAAARDLAHAHGALLVFDEIVHGFRIARGGMQEHFGVVPDMAAFAKGMANGLPLAAVVGRKDVMEVAAHAQISITYGGEALSLAACAAVLKEYREKDVMGHLWRVGQQLKDGLNAAAEAAGVPFACVGDAPLSAIEFALPREQVGPAWELFLAECARRGVLFRRGGLNMMNFSHTSEDVSRAASVAAEALDGIRAAGYTARAGGASGGQQVGPWSAPSSPGSAGSA
jgi:glutamate-1-semialdehyde aminotransferase